MSDTRKLLDQLRLERTNAVPGAMAAGSGRRLRTGLFVGLVLAIGTAAFWWLATRPEPVLAETVPAEPASASAALATAASADDSVLNASGYIIARRQATVSAKITARVMEVFIDEGQKVAAGEVIATLDDSNARAAHAYSLAQLEQAQAALRAAQSAFDSEAPLFSRMQQQYARDVISAQDFDTARARYEAARSSLDVAASGLKVAQASLDMTQRNVDDTVVRAPFAGTVTVKAAQPGEMVSPVSAGGGFTRTGIGTIVDMDSLEVDVDVSENFIHRITAGQPASVRLNAYPEWAIAGRVITVVPTADRAKATVKVRIALEQSDARILPDMGARVAFLRTAAADAIHTQE
jgi:RND family efflux transporter MFP subunit